MIRKYRYHIRIRRNIKRVQSSVASEHAEVTGRSLIERRGSGWGDRRLVVAASNVAVAAFVSAEAATPAPAPNWAAFIADGPQSIQIAISMRMKRR
jgi:hypothetical protein